VDLNEAVKRLLDAWADVTANDTIDTLWEELVEVKKAYYNQLEEED
jgi:hypothetical protein